jgi:UDP-hydrolysing UDP-N-acetyl-D-glucosamine 2-epimerase
MRVCVVTGTRAEFGLLQGLISLIDASTDYELQLVATGTHLLDDFGHTVDAITDSGFTITAEVPEITYAMTGRDVATQVGKGIVSFTDTFSTLAPDALVVLGDRYEMLAAATAAFFLGIPIMHLHGGEVTDGAFDDTIRHAITKLSHIHCVAHEDYARRVIQLGEQPENVHVVGSLGVDQLAMTKLMSQRNLEAELGLKLEEPLFLVTYHPVTSGVSNATEEVRNMVTALEDFPAATVVATMPNGDPEHHLIAAALLESVERHKGRWIFSQSLGQARYWSLMGRATAVVGNSSSGVIEAPTLKTATVNIGPRQRGRIMAPSVVSCAPDSASIVAALRQVMGEEFQKSLVDAVNPLGGPGASKRVFALLQKLERATLKGKVFHDLTTE